MHIKVSYNNFMSEKLPTPERPEPKVVGPASDKKKEEYKKNLKDKAKKCGVIIKTQKI